MLGFRSWRSSGTPLGFGQEFLTKEQFENTGVSPTVSRLGFSWFLTARLKTAVKGRRSWDADIIKNETEEMKRLLPASSNISNTLTVAGWRLYMHKETILKEMYFKCGEREKTNNLQKSDVYYQLLSQHVSVIIMPIFRRTKAVLLHMVYCSGSAGCGW